MWSHRRPVQVLPVITTLIASCGGVRDYLPQGAPQSEDARARWLDAETAPLAQPAPPADVAPVPPLQLFAAYYAADIVLETKRSGWTMHEYAQVEVGDRRLWVAKDSDADGVQTITADLEDVERWLPEIPVPRRRGEVVVDDRSTDAQLDVVLRYTNPRGVPVRVAFSAPAIELASLENERNGSTFDHSQQAVSALLDVRRRQQKGIDAEVAFGDERASIRRVLGLVPVKALLEQIQGGIAAASFAARTEADALALRRPAPGTAWPTASDERWVWRGDRGTGTLSHAAFGVAHRYDFEAGGLAAARVDVDGLDAPGFALRLSAPLPDVTRPFEGPVRRHFVAEVGGQPHGYGTIDARWAGGEAVVELRPDEPRWFRARPVRSRVRTSTGGAVRVESRILDPDSGAPRSVVTSARP